MHCAVFAVVRCPSVRLFVTFVYYVETAKPTIKLFSSPDGRPVFMGVLWVLQRPGPQFLFLRA